MAEISATSIRQFQQLRNRQSDLRRKNSLALAKAVQARKTAKISQLIAQQVELNQMDQKIQEAEIAFVASGLPQSDAERALVAKTREANKLVNAVQDISRSLAVVGRFAGLLTDLIAILR